jgi:hypothetical protein
MLYTLFSDGFFDFAVNQKYACHTFIPSPDASQLILLDDQGVTTHEFHSCDALALGINGVAA